VRPVLCLSARPWIFRSLASRFSRLIQPALAFRHEEFGKLGAVIRVERFGQFVRGMQPGFARQAGGDAARQLVAERGKLAPLDERQAALRTRQPVGGKRRALRFGQPLAVLVEGIEALGDERKNQRDARAAFAGWSNRLQIIAPLIEITCPEM
jgi:hypothetical protein